MIWLWFFCSTWDNKLNTRRIIRLQNLSEKKLYEVFEKNLNDLIMLLEYSKNLWCTIFRLGSEFIPFISHKNFEKSWLKYIEKRLLEEKNKIKSFWIRITMHPWQFILLNSDKEDVIKNSLNELWYHFWILDILETKDPVVVIHWWASYWDKKKSIQKLIKTIENNKWLIKMLAIENDEKIYSIEDLYEVWKILPLVFDYYHHQLNPSRLDIDYIISTWWNKKPKMHLSSKPNKQHRFWEHWEYIDLKDYINLSNLIWNYDVDVILEAKMKDLALKKLIQDLTTFSR